MTDVQFIDEAQEGLDPDNLEPESFRPRDLDELARLLEQEEAASAGLTHDRSIDRQALGYNSYLANEQIHPYTNVDERETTSRVISRDVSEVIDWLMPDLMRVITGDEYLVEFTAAKKEHQDFVNQATDLVNHHLRAQGPDLYREIHDWLKDGLIAKVGILRIAIIDPITRWKTISSLGMEEAMYIQQQAEGQTRIRQEDNGLVSLEVMEESRREFRVEAVPPEHLRIENNAKTLSQRDASGPRYVGVSINVTVAAAIEEWPEFKDKILIAASQGDSDANYFEDNEETLSEAREIEMETQSIDNIDGEDMQNIFAQRIKLKEEYYRVDLDGDEIPELVRCIRVGHTILDHAPVRDNPFVSWCPYPIPHLFFGESVADKIVGLQDVKTAFWRIVNDSAALAARPRVAVDYTALAMSGAPTLEDVIQWEAGAVIRTPGPPQSSILPIEMGDVATPALNALAYADEQKQAWSGVNRQKQGLDPDAVNRSAQGASLVQEASNSRPEFIAHMAAWGIMELGSKLLSNIIDYSEGPTEILVRGQTVQVDPTKWDHDLRPVVHVSGAAGNRSHEVNNLINLFNLQERFITMFGPMNPIISMEQVGETMREATKAMGFRDPRRFAEDAMPEQIEEWAMMQAEQKDPAVVKAELDADMKEKEIDTEFRHHQFRLNKEAATKRFEVKSDAAIENKKIDTDYKMHREKLEQEEELKEKELVVEREKIQAQKEAAKAQAEAAAQRPAAA